MARVMKTCRVCGKQYEACHTPNTSGVFRWRDVACSRECGSIYLERVMASRKPQNDADAVEAVAPSATINAEPIVETEVNMSHRKSTDENMAVSTKSKTKPKKEQTIPDEEV